MKILAFGGALRADSSNRKFAREALRLALEAGEDGEFLDLRDYPMPPYDGDIEAGSGIPETVRALGKKISAADAIILSTPEYNGSMPGVLKNVIDWLSREKPVSLSGKPLLLLAASPGALGGVRVLWHGRQTLEVLGMHVFPGGFGLSGADKAFDASGRLADPKNETRLKDLVTQFIAHVKR